MLLRREGLTMKKIYQVFIVFLLLFVTSINSFATLISTEDLSFGDFARIYKDKNYKKDITDKILSTPIIDNNINVCEKYLYKSHPKLKDLVVVSQWDLMFSMDSEQIYQAFLEPQKLVEQAEKDYQTKMARYIEEKDDDDEYELKTLEEVKAKIADESEILQSSDIIVLNNVDIGMPRTQYKNMPLELAKKLNYNYAFAPEFIEVDPATLGLVDYKWSDSRMVEESNSSEYTVDRDKYKGLTGTAILSRFPLKNVRIIPLIDVYDWYDCEKNNNYKIEEAVRTGMKTVFKEDNIRQIRLGHRMALVADIELKEGTFTIVGTQIEKRTRPNERAKQMKYLLSQISDIEHPVILTGNLNTTTYNHQPKSVKTMAKNKITDPDAVAETLFFLAVPVGMAVSWVVRPIFDIFRKVNDPTVISIPIISPNREKKMFNAIRRFEFADGCKFDFRGNPETSINNSSKLFSSSNERGKKGYISTYKTKRTFGISNYKISWILAKSYNKKNKPKNSDQACEKMAPHFGRTLYALNFSYLQPIAIQAPITAVFPLTDYKKSVK